MYHEFLLYSGKNWNNEVYLIFPFMKIFPSLLGAKMFLLYSSECPVEFTCSFSFFPCVPGGHTVFELSLVGVRGGGNSLLLLFLKQGMSAWIHLCLFFSTCVPGGHTMFFLSLSDSHFCEWVSLTNFNECFFCCYCMWVVHTVIFLASSLPCLVHGFAEGLKTAAPNEFFGSKLLLCLGTMS